MKKILVIIKPFIGCENAMSNAVMPLLEKAKEKYEVDVYSLSSANSNKIVENIDGYKVYWHDYLGEGYKKYFRKIKLVLVYIREIDCRIITKRKFIYLIEIINKILNSINIKLFLKMLNLFEKKPWFNCLEEIVENNAYDAIISISSPIAIQANCLKLIKNKNLKEKNTLWIPYYLDPFATYKGNLEKACSHILMNFEEEVYEYADYILTTPEIKKDNLNYTLKKYDFRVFPVQLSNLNFDKEYSDSCVRLDHSKINCIFTGSFFDISIRNPNYLFQVLSNIPDEIHVYIATFLLDKKILAFKEKYIDNKQNIHWLNRLPIDECFKLMNDCDVLINVGNESPNQTPSKVFDYISTMKCIINFYSINDDTSKWYLSNYPYVLNIKNGGNVEDDTKKFIEFAKMSKKTIIDRDLIKEKYINLSSPVISNEFINTLNLLIK